MLRLTRRPPTAFLPLLALVLGACSGPATGTGTGSPSTPAADPGQTLSISDPWVKAADTGMTAAFGRLTNDSDTDVTIVSATSDAASSVELHEMVMGADGAMVMREKAGGVVIEAGGTHELAPGGDHLMLMGLTGPVQPGDEISVMLTTQDGSTVEFTAAARSFSGAQEEYPDGMTDSASPSASDG